MARETKTQRLEREALERQKAEDAERAEYTERLMKALNRATVRFAYELLVVDKFFLVKTESYNDPYKLSLEWSTVSQRELEDLEDRMDQADAARAEQARRNQVRDNALKKVQELFTAEERELLDLK
jgi:Skp family chaperone for outer membrane proteins